MNTRKQIQYTCFSILSIIRYKTMHHKNFFNHSSLDSDLFVHAHLSRRNDHWDRVHEK
ncbi:hypothetical protein K501DRAFT_7304 [Backusella circina FSU 941]|nr:hypothetical protein K501DRAFT_7304 [Backusella circina FSU 941]